MNITNLFTHTTANQPFDTFAIDVLTGLSGHPKAIPAQYFYDDIGSELFQKISQHADYYPTRTEFSILAKAALVIPTMLQVEEIDVIELGAGDGHKSKLLVDGFLAQGCKVNFYPIDISEKAMQQLCDNFSESSMLSIHGIVADYFTGLHHIKRVSSHPKLVLFLGSNIGNFNRPQRQEFLKKVWLSLNAADHVLIGYDLKKATQLLNRAYNDSDGLTKAFNLNLLHRMNNALGANFVVENFEHYGFYNPTSAAMESHLISLHPQEVYIAALEKHFHFAQFESIHVESSYKFTSDDMGNMAGHNGFKVKHHFSDDHAYFIDALWQVQHKE